MGRITRLRNAQPVASIPPASTPTTDKFAIQRANSGDYLTEAVAGLGWARSYTASTVLSFDTREKAQHYMTGLPTQAEQLRIVRLPLASALLKE